MLTTLVVVEGGAWMSSRHLRSIRKCSSFFFRPEVVRQLNKLSAESWITPCTTELRVELAVLSLALGTLRYLSIPSLTYNPGQNRWNDFEATPSPHSVLFDLWFTQEPTLNRGKGKRLGTRILACMDWIIYSSMAKILTARSPFLFS